MKLWNKLSFLWRRNRLERSMAEEMQAHVEGLTERNVKEGMPPEEARNAALRAFGGVEQIKELARDERSWAWLENLQRDVRFSLRSLRRSPGFSAAVITVLALCVGANTTIMSALYCLIIKPLPFDEPNRIIEIRNSATLSRFNQLPGSVAQYLDYQANAKSCEKLALWDQAWRLYGEDGSLERLPCAFATAEIFQVLHVKPVVGSLFTRDQNKPGADDVVVLTESFWTSRFHRDPTVIGKTVWIDRQKVIVVGVVERAMESFDARVDFIRPFSWPPERETPTSRYAGFGRLIGRLTPGATVAQANEEVRALEHRFADTAPAQMAHYIQSSGLTVNVETVQAERVQLVGPALYLLQAGAAFVLLIGCVNVANLLLVRANAKRSEVSIRSALGASRGAIGRQFLIEGLLLSGLGSGLGLSLAWASLRVINRYTGALLPQAQPVTLDHRMLGLAVVLTLAIGLAVGLIPLIHVLRVNLSGVMQSSSRSASAGRGVRSLSSLLAIGQVAVALVLLTGAGLLILAFQRAVSVDSGLDTSGVGWVTVNVPSAYRATDEAGQSFRDRVEVAMREIPGVTSTAFTYSVPFHGGAGAAPLVLADDPRPAGSPQLGVFLVAASPGYLSTMGLRLVEGRFFEPRDAPMALRYLVVDEALAKKYFPNRSAIGERIAFGGPPRNEADWPTIIGVVKNVPHNGVEDRSGNPFVYWYMKGHPSAFGLFFRTQRPVGDALTAVREKIRAIDPAIAVYNQTTLDFSVAESFDTRRAVMLLLTAFAALALILAALGIYSLLAYDVVQRTREIGIRGAIGATRPQLIRMIVSQGLRRAGIGIGAGLVAAWLLSRYLTSLLFEVRPTDPAVYAAVSILLLLVATLASYLPARRASKIDPVVALRSE